jgi:membrane protein
MATIVTTGTTQTPKILPPRIETTGVEELQPVRKALSLRWCQIRCLLETTFNSAIVHKIQRLGASLAFYSALSLAPLLIVIVAIVGLAFSKEATTGYLVYQIGNLVGHDGAEVIKTLLNGARKPTSGAIATTLGLFTLFIGASTVVTELKDALNTIWEVPVKPARAWASIMTMVKTRLVSFAMVLAVGFLLMVSLALNAALSAASSLYRGYLPTSPIALQAADMFVTVVVIGCLFAAMFKFLPDVYVDWADVLLGALITSVLFTIGKLLIGIYLGRASITSTYGAAGSLVVLLLWIYYSAQIFYLGAEFTHAYAEVYGSRPSDHFGREVQIVEGVTKK